MFCANNRLLTIPCFYACSSAEMFFSWLQTFFFAFQRLRASFDLQHVTSRENQILLQSYLLIRALYHPYVLTVTCAQKIFPFEVFIVSELQPTPYSSHSCAEQLFLYIYGSRVFVRRKIEHFEKSSIKPERLPSCLRVGDLL